MPEIQTKIMDFRHILTTKKLNRTVRKQNIYWVSQIDTSYTCCNSGCMIKICIVYSDTA